MQQYFSVNFRVTFSSEAPSQNDFYRVLHFIAIFSKLWQSLACSSLGIQKNQNHATQLGVHYYALVIEQSHHQNFGHPNRAVLVCPTLTFLFGTYAGLHPPTCYMIVDLLPARHVGHHDLALVSIRDMTSETSTLPSQASVPASSKVKTHESLTMSSQTD